jgi:large subunit ribosomal protein L25
MLQYIFLFVKLTVAMKEIKVEKRTKLGKKTKQLRREGLIPGVIYNAKGESIAIQINRSDLFQLLKDIKTSDIITISLGKEKKQALLKQTDADPLTGEITHISFFEIVPDTTVDVEIPIELEGISPAVKNNLGVLVQPIDSIILRCPVENIPSSLKVDLSNLTHVGQTVLLSDLALPKGVRFIRKEDSNKPVVTITSVQKQEVMTTEAEEGVEETTEEERASVTPEDTTTEN